MSTFCMHNIMHQELGVCSQCQELQGQSNEEFDNDMLAILENAHFTKLQAEAIFEVLKECRARWK